MKDWIEYRIEEKRKWTYHYHNFKGHDEENKNATPCDNTFTPFFNA